MDRKAFCYEVQMRNNGSVNSVAMGVVINLTLRHVRVISVAKNHAIILHYDLALRSDYMKRGDNSLLTASDRCLPSSSNTAAISALSICPSPLVSNDWHTILRAEVLSKQNTEYSRVRTSCANATAKLLCNDTVAAS